MLPLIEEVFGQMIGCNHLTTLDIIAAFNKLHMDIDSEDLTTFIITLEVYKYRVLTFALTNSLRTFQHYINDKLCGFFNEFCQAYLHNILIYCKTIKEQGLLHGAGL